MEQLKKGEVKGTVIRSNVGTPAISSSPRKDKHTASKGHRVHFTVEATEQSLKNLTTIEVRYYFVYKYILIYFLIPRFATTFVK